MKIRNTYRDSKNVCGSRRSPNIFLSKLPSLCCLFALHIIFGTLTENNDGIGERCCILRGVNGAPSMFGIIRNHPKKTRASSSSSTSLLSSRKGSLHDQYDAMSLSRSKLYRWRQRCQHKRLMDRRIPKLKHQHQKRSIGHKGSMLTWRIPTEAMLTRWFWGNPGAVVSSSTPTSTRSEGGQSLIFNHGTAGFTNPCIHIDPTPKVMSSPRWGSSITAKVDKVIPASSTASSRTDRRNDTSRRSTTGNDRSSSDVEDAISNKVQDVRASTTTTKTAEDAWWPSMTSLPSWTSTTTTINECWHTIRLRQRVGDGYDCYERVRDAALNWEFTSNNQREGIRVVQPPCSPFEENPQRRRGRNGRATFIPNFRRYSVLPSSLASSSSASSSAFRPSANALQIWSGPGRRLVTYTRKLFVTVTNPVSVVYDCVDQRGGKISNDFHNHDPASIVSSSSMTSSSSEGAGTAAGVMIHDDSNNNDDDIGVIYSSTAYATMKGHWLCGEERVTVAYRPVTGHVDVEILSLSQPAPSSVVGKVLWPFVTKTNGLQQRFFREQMSALQKVASGTGQ